MSVHTSIQSWSRKMHVHSSVPHIYPLTNPPPPPTHSQSMQFPREDFVMIQSTTPKMRKLQSSNFLSGRLSLTPNTSTSLTHSQTGRNSSLVRMVSSCAYIYSVAHLIRIHSCTLVCNCMVSLCVSMVSTLKNPQGCKCWFDLSYL